jgi:hypothetical protein
MNSEFSVKYHIKALQLNTELSYELLICLISEEIQIVMKAIARFIQINVFFYVIAIIKLLLRQLQPKLLGKPLVKLGLYFLKR